MTKTLDDFNREYLELHVRKEDLFWTTYMGVEKDPQALETAERKLKAYLSDPARFVEVRSALAELEKAGPASEDYAGSKTGLQGWLRLFEANAIEDEAGRKLQTELIEAEAALFQKRAKLRLTYRDRDGNETPGSTNVMAANIAASPDERVRKTSHEALLRLEQWVLANGFIELVKKRNTFARRLGYRTYFEYKISKLERLTRDELFSILEDFEHRTREKCFAELERLKREKGEQSVLGHNLRFAISGDVQGQVDPYFQFEKSLEIWCQSFARLGIEYRGARLSLDLLDREGKYENGFMHGPEPSFFDRGHWRPARINFTSNATPNQVGSGRRALITLFHEGGHAAHFANITMNAPCFSQEFPPTSMALAETQSMFLDSLVEDADWLSIYAKDASGRSMPEDLIRLLVTRDHPFKAFGERSILVVPYFESRLYALDESEMTPERITRLARDCEKEILGVNCSPRPLLAIPHLLGADGSCSYQGYLLAHMAVYQTRAHFLKTHGHLVDNPRVGPDLAKHYWNPGNSISHSDAIRSLTGEGLSGRALADHCNLATEELWKLSDRQIAAARGRTHAPVDPAALKARIHLVHGAEEIANNMESGARMISDFESWISRQYPRPH